MHHEGGLSLSYCYSSVIWTLIPLILCPICHLPLLQSLEDENIGGEKHEIQIESFTRCLE